MSDANSMPIHIPSSLTEVAVELEKLHRTQEIISKQIADMSDRLGLADIEQKLSVILDAIKTAADETSGNHQERVRLVQSVRALERRVEALEERNAV